VALAGRDHRGLTDHDWSGSSSGRQALSSPVLWPNLYMTGGNVILLASARLRTYLPWTSAVLNSDFSEPRLT
jgi:hypothetical protein